jgi:AcrR family transcriptional regulator
MKGGCPLYSNFEGLSEEKKDRIIWVCIEEFAQKGYGKASTNTIVKMADISKGILFHYFGSKRNLYLYVLDYAVDFAVRKFYSMNSEPPSDIFERILKFSVIKLKMFYNEPLIYKFIYSAFISTHEELKDDIQERYNRLYGENTETFLKGIDTSAFRKDIDPGKGIESIMLFMDAITNKYLAKYRSIPADEAFANLDNMIRESLEYLDILKYGIYHIE